MELYLQKEIIRSEKRRLEAFIGVLILGLIMGISLECLNLFFDQESFKNVLSLPFLMATNILTLSFFLIARRWVSRVAKKGMEISRAYYWYTVIIEITIPCSWLIIASIMEESAAMLDSPVIFLMVILIIVSSLHLNFWLSFAMGSAMGLFLAVFTYWVINKYPVEFNLPIATYYVRSLMFLMAGACAGLVAYELKKRLSKTIGEMAEKENIEGLFNQQVSKEIANVLREQEDYTARLNATILFLDIRDFTKKVQGLSPEEVNAFQNAFFGPIMNIVTESKGVVNQILGDGMMATFGAPVTDSTHYNCAWTAVTGIRQFLVEFRKEFPEHANLEIGMGMHCGEVMVGNIGNKARRQLSVSGAPVIVASRIEQLNKELESSLLISKGLFLFLKEKIGPYEFVGKFKLKGIDNEVELIKIL